MSETAIPPEQPSAWRAWWALVRLSLARQARARQMVVLAVGLAVLTTLIVGYLAALGRFGMSHWRHPRGAGPTFPAVADQAQLLTSVATHADAGGLGVSMAVVGAFRVLVTAGVRDGRGEPVAGAGFYIFSRGVVFLVVLTFLLPLWSLSFATEAIGGEREGGGLMWTLTRPIPRPMIYLARWVALLPWAIGLNLGGFAAICLAAGPPGRLALALYWPGVLWATLAFASLFLLIGAAFRRPAVVALIYSFCLEMVLGNMPGYLKRVSVSFYARCVMFERASEYGMEAEKPAVFLPVDGLTAQLVLIGAAVGLLALGMWVFSRAEYQSEEG